MPQSELQENPEAGELIPGTGGARKIRMALRGRGKRGGARVIYYYRVSLRVIAFLDIYVKSEKADLTADEKWKMAWEVNKLKKGEA